MWRKRRDATPRRVWHRGRGRGRGRWGLFTWLQVIGMGAVLVGALGYAVWLFAFAQAAPAEYLVYLPLVGR